SADNRLGWLGRYLDRAGSDDNPLQGLSVSDNLSPVLAAHDRPVAALASPSDYTFSSPGVDDPVNGSMLGAIGGLGALPTRTSETQLAGARRVAVASGRLREQ